MLRHQYSDGQIDELLAANKLTYADVVGLLAEDEGQRKSLLKVIFTEARDNAALLADWLASPGVDKTIIEKSARSELCKLIGSRLGLELGDDVELADARSKTLRYILVGEFRDDYEGEAPPAAGMIPSPPTKDHVKFVRELAESLRRRHADQYSKLADQVEAELGFTGAALPPEKLGRIDTFRFEERAAVAIRRSVDRRPSLCRCG